MGVERGGAVDGRHPRCGLAFVQLRAVAVPHGGVADELRCGLFYDVSADSTRLICGREK